MTTPDRRREPELDGGIDMARGTRKARRTTALAALALTAVAALGAGPAAAAPAHHRPHHRVVRLVRAAGPVYIVSGTLAVAPGAAPTTLQVQVTGGNRLALRALVGTTSQPLGFAVDARTSYVAWTASTRGNAPTGTTSSTLLAGDPVHLRIRAPRGIALATLLATPTRIVNDLAAAQRVAGRMFVFEGRAISVDATAQTVTMQVQRGNWNALDALLGQSTTETFHYDAATIFVSWSHRTPHTFLPAQIQAGDPITVRTRAAFRTPLTNLLAAPLWKVNDHEPTSSLDADGGTLAVEG
jgi:hypothetical protein